MSTPTAPMLPDEPPPTGDLLSATPPSTLDPQNKFVTIEMPDDGPGSLSWWLDEIERAKKIRTKLLPLWKRNLKRYKGDKGALNGIDFREVIGVNIDFSNTEAKKAQLNYQTASMQLFPKRQDDAAIAPLQEVVINSYLDEISAIQTADEVIVDVICPSGIGFTEIGYQAYMGEPIPQPRMETRPTLDQLTQQPQVGPDGQPVMSPQPVLDPSTGQPVVDSIPNIIREKFYWDRVSPAKGIIPASFDRSDYDEAPWLGVDGQFPEGAGSVEFGVKPNEFARSETDQNRLNEDPDVLASGGMIDYVKIWYRSNTVRPDVADPERFTQLVLSVGNGRSKTNSQVLVHRDSPYQELDARGKFARGMRGNPIHVLTIRYTSDSAYPMSDCSMSRNQVDELAMSRSQMIRQRNRNLPMRGIDISRDPAGKETAERIGRGTEQSVIPFNGPPREILAVISPANLPNENFKFQEIILADIERIWSIGAASGQVYDETATKTSEVSRLSQTRLAKERGRVNMWTVRGGVKILSLLQMFGDAELFSDYLTPQQAAQLVAWNQQKGTSAFRFTARPDSSVHIDAAQMRELALRFYNLFASDPNVNRMELDRWVMSLFPDMDPSRFLNQTPPQPHAERPKIGITLSGDDLSALAPQFSVVCAILQENGIPIPENVKAWSAMSAVGSAQAQQQSELVKHPTAAKRLEHIPHPGAVKKVETVDQHSADRTGQPTGAPPMTPGALIQ